MECRWQTSSIKHDSLLPCHQVADAVITAVINGKHVNYIAVHFCNTVLIVLCVGVTSSSNFKWLSP